MQRHLWSSAAKKIICFSESPSESDLWTASGSLLSECSGDYLLKTEQVKGWGVFILAERKQNSF